MLQKQLKVLNSGKLHLAISTARRVGLLSLLFLSGAVSAFAQAPKTCIPPPRGTPGFTNPRPNWFDSGQTAPDYQPGLLDLRPYDPRWIGAASHDYGASNSEAEFLALSNVEQSVTYLYLSWYMKSTPNNQPPSLTQTSLYAGFMPSGVNQTGTIIEITLNQTTPSETDNTKPWVGEPLPEPQINGGVTYYNAAVFQGSGTTSWNSVNPTPAWATQSTRVWVSTTNPYKWAVQMKIPVDPTGANGIKIDPSNFLMWYYFQPATEILGNMISYIPYTWPRTTTDSVAYAVYVDAGTGNTTYPDPGTWAPFAVKDPSTDMSCQTGVYLADDQIGTLNTMYQSKISLTGTNTFFAKPTNYSGNNISAGILTATFNLANWGSQVGDLTGTSWTSPPTLTNVSDPTGIPGIPRNLQGNIQGFWTLSHDERCKFIGKTGVTDFDAFPPQIIPGDPTCSNTNPSLELHQCMFVKLNGPGIDFSRDSAFKNMDFVGASSFNRDAEINIGVAAAAINGDVYIYVETRNMPSVADTLWKQLFNNLFGPPEKRTVDSNRAVIAKMSAAEIRRTVPTYIVHVYRDTGKTLYLHGAKHPVLQPQTSFGYFVIPHADVSGWTSQLQGATQISPGWYKLSVGSSGVQKIKTSVQAIELPPIGGCGKKASSATAFAILFGMFLVGVVTYLPMARKTRR